MITENLNALKIFEMSQEQYDRRLHNGEIDHNAFYLTDGEVSGGCNLDGITAADIGAAPDGYGLGSAADKTLSFSEINDARETGWYNIEYGALIVNNVNFYCLRVESFDYPIDGAIIQTAYGFLSAADMDVPEYDKTYPIMIQRCWEDEWGCWQDWEFINPPMMANVPYLTTERFNGMPVYSILVDFGDVWKTNTTYSIKIPAIQVNPPFFSVISYSGVVRDSESDKSDPGAYYDAAKYIKSIYASVNTSPFVLYAERNGESQAGTQMILRVLVKFVYGDI